MSQTLIQFDYSQLGDDAIPVRESTVRIKALQRSASESIVEIGKELLLVKSLVQRGQFDAWVEQEFEWSRVTAYKLMAVAAKFGDSYTICTIRQSALYLLASESTPDEAVAEAIHRADHGEEITHKVAKEIVARHKEKPEFTDETLEAEREQVESIARGDFKPSYPTIISESLDTYHHETDGPAVRATSLEHLAGLKFGTIYADPPWQYGNQATRASTDNHYSTMTIDDLCAMPIEQFAADDAHLHLWTTNAFLRDAYDVMKAWGFEYRSCFVWCKPQMGIGNYWRVSHEFLLLGIRGNAKRFNDHGLMSWAEIDREKHSAKPQQVRRMIEKASPGPYLELFGREVVGGWTVFGNQVDDSVLFA
jgi:N6-adenosine-specific RNA methylase IME4